MTTSSRLNQKLTKLLFKQFFEFWPYYIGAFLCLFLTHYIQSELPFLAKQLADFISVGKDFSVGQLFLLAIGIIIFRTSSRLLFFYPARVQQKHLRLELIETLEKASPYRYKNHSKGQIFQVIGSDLEEVRALVGFALLQISNIVIALSVLIPKLASFDKTIFIALSPVLVAFILFSFIVASNRKFYRKTQDLQGEVQNFIIESYLGKKTIKNFHAEKSFIDLFKKNSMDELINFYKAGKRVAISIPLVPTGVGLSLIWGAYIIFQKDLGATSLILFSGFVFLFLEPMMFLSWIGVVFTRSSGAWSRVGELVADLETPSAMENSIIKDGALKIDGDYTELMLPYWNHEITLNTKKGCSTIIVGETGSGKTELLLKTAELLKANGHLVSYVAQDPYLYNGSIIENLELGNEFDDDKFNLAYELLTIFGLSFLASSKETLFSLVVGEDGKRLSGGQAKRVALVKSLLSESEYIIWDDPFSSVDVVLEKEIYDKLHSLKLLDGKTLLLTGHRYTTVAMCEHIILIDKESGVVETTNNKEILKDSRIYAHFEKQLI